MLTVFDIMLIAKKHQVKTLRQLSKIVLQDCLLITLSNGFLAYVNSSHIDNVCNQILQEYNRLCELRLKIQASKNL